MRLLAALLLASLAAAAHAEDQPPWNNPTNCSGTIANAGVAQQMIPAGVRHGYTVQNESTDKLGFSEITTSPSIGAAGTWVLAPSSSAVTGGAFTTPYSYSGSAGAVFIIGPNGGDAYTCVSW